MSNRFFTDPDQVRPPPAPPLPPQTSPARAAANVFARFAHTVNDAARPSDGGRDRVEGAGGPKPSISSDSSSPTTSRSTTHRTGLAIAAVDISPDKTRAILAGRDILKTVVVSDQSCTEDVNLKEKITRYASTRETSANSLFTRQRERIGAHDVKWSNGAYDTSIATAAANGQIAVYDLNRVEVELVRFHEHTRQIHKLAFSPHGGSLLLSGSQDATVRLWDLRALWGQKSVLTCQSRSRFAGNSDGVRDIRWCPVDALEFAMGTDSGTVQRWDIRKESSPLTKVNAHEKMCISIDWHQGGKHLLSAGADKRLNIWDFASSDRRMKPLWTIRLPHAASNARWRPASWSVKGHLPGSWRSTQVAVSYGKSHLVHVWDLQRPTVPYRAINTLSLPLDDFLWHSKDLLWSVDASGTFTQSDVSFASRTMEKRNVNPIAIAPDGRIVFASMTKEARRPTDDNMNDDHVQVQHQDGRSERSRAVISTSDGSTEDTSLLSSFKSRRNRTGSSLRSEIASSTTPPTSSGVPTENLIQSLQDKHMFQNRQVMGIGYVPGVFDAEAFKFCAKHYRFPPLETRRFGKNLHVVLAEALKHNSAVARFAEQYETAKTWEVLAFAVENELRERIENRSGRSVSGEKVDRRQDSSRKGQHDVKSKMSDPLRSNKPSGVSESKSSISRPTPALPAAKYIDKTVMKSEAAAAIGVPSDSDKDESFKPKTGMIDFADLEASRRLGQADSKSPKSTSLSSEVEPRQIKETSMTQPLTTPNTDLSDLDRQMAERRIAAGNYRAPQRSLLKFDNPFSASQVDSATRDARKDSIGSFQMLSDSAGSSNKNQSASGSYESSLPFGSLDARTQEHGTLRHRGSRDRTGQAENALLFDDEAEMTAHEMGRLAFDSPTEEGEAGRNVFASAGKASKPLFRPSTPQAAIVHTSDMHADSQLLESTADKTSQSNAEISDDFPAEEDYHLDDEEDSDKYYPPWKATAILPRMIEYHAQKLYDAQLPAYLLLVVVPYFNIPITHERAREIIHFYHARLESLQLYVQAAEIRNLAAESYPQIPKMQEYGIDSGGPWCTRCKKASKGLSPGFCERCNKPWDPCSVCHGHGPLSAASLRSVNDNVDTVNRPKAINSQANDALWSWCQVCGHGGHTGCLRQLWAQVLECSGACPHVGCDCDCAPGPRRDEKHERLREAWKRGADTSHAVKRDEWRVGESGAVTRTRGMVGAASSTAGGVGVGDVGRNTVTASATTTPTTLGDSAGGGSATTTTTGPISEDPSSPEQSRTIGKTKPGPDHDQSTRGGGIGRSPLSLSAAGRSSSGSKKVRIVEPVVKAQVEASDDNGGESGEASSSAP